ncbi:MAG: hypothetical protein AB8B78_12140 [Polaribacter sp.]
MKLHQRESIFTKNTILIFLLSFFFLGSVYAQDSFESDLDGWSNASGDQRDWTRDSGGTPTSQTGPSSGAIRIFYMYLETSSPVATGDKAWLQKEFSIVNNINPDSDNDTIPDYLETE